MRIIAIKTLKEFIDKYPDSQASIQEWIKKMSKGNYKTPQEVIIEYKDADFVGNTRIVFNISRNKYRMIVAFRYDKQICWIKFIGTHAEYDKIDARTIEF
ncbi:type II toxin-antitoxin system HigB family toxin [Emticicia agri]|uniref:Type II toxin-antitoxin system HigB family toxin n=1 Tax=Emticicia agri TaxID=2492393 RepID=A0A4V1ZDV0_9BACT|nr:type II toxin-antitoxin system HigB family toxin [Emticicia agri]RYU97430.1 type II toxin-antitoxin system HigB family toxin [Emticicia agri]